MQAAALAASFAGGAGGKAAAAGIFAGLLAFGDDVEMTTSAAAAGLTAALSYRAGLVACMLSHEVRTIVIPQSVF